MEEMGMTDLQFKSWLKQHIKNLERAVEEPDKEKTDAKLKEVIASLTEDLQG